MGLCGILLEVLKNFVRETSVAGLNNAGKAKSKLRILYWTVIFLVLIYFTMTAFIGVITDFQAHPVSTSSDQMHRTNVLFPAVSVCNQNRF